MLGIKGSAQRGKLNENFHKCARKLQKIASKTFHKNTLFGLTSRICVECFVQDGLHSKFCNVYRKKTSASKSLF